MPAQCGRACSFQWHTDDLTTAEPTKGPYEDWAFVHRRGSLRGRQHHTVGQTWQVTAP